MYKVLYNRKIAKKTYKMVLEGDTSKIKNAGQFVNIKLGGLFLRRPISICDYDFETVTVIYKVVGEGTERMSKMPVGTELDVLTGLGNGFDTSGSGQAPLLIGGGAGLPPMLALAKKLVSEGKKPTVIAGFNSKDEVFLEDEFEKISVPFTVTTLDGSYGIKGLVTDAMNTDYTYFYSCGPLQMLKAVSEKSKTDGEISLEERMGCGFGICMGCSRKTVKGSKRICKDGPVFRKEEIIW